MSKLISDEEILNAIDRVKSGFVRNKLVAKAQRDSSDRELGELIKEIELLWKPQHHNLCYGIIDPHPDCVCCKWQALKQKVEGE